MHRHQRCLIHTVNKGVPVLHLKLAMCYLFMAGQRWTLVFVWRFMWRMTSDSSEPCQWITSAIIKPMCTLHKGVNRARASAQVNDYRKTSPVTASGVNTPVCTCAVCWNTSLYTHLLFIICIEFSRRKGSGHLQINSFHIYPSLHNQPGSKSETPGVGKVDHCLREGESEAIDVGLFLGVPGVTTD